VDPTVTIKCTKCGAPSDLDAGAKFMRCDYCESQIYIDKSGAGFYYVLPYQLDAAAADGVFRRWAAGSDKAKDLESSASVVSSEATYFPVFMFRRDVDGRENVYVEPAKSTTLPGLHNLKIPPGDLKVFDQKYDFGGVELEDPNIEMVAYLDKLPGEAKEQALVYFPIYNIVYDYAGSRYQVTIDGSSAEVFASIWPPRMAAGYYAIGIAGFIGCTIGGAMLAGNAVCGTVILVLMIPAVFAGGYWVAVNQ
jgi:DNA-directed RNA polymerase subunit RPC12/RpoP